MMKFKKGLVLSLSLMLLVANMTTAFAAATIDTQEATTGGTKNATVTINSTSSFKVTVPSTITVNQATKAKLNETYNVKVEGDIAGNEKVTVTPSASFDLTSTGKDTITATVTQAKTDFSSSEISAVGGSTISGTITTADDITAGEWTGTLVFNIGTGTN